MFPALKEATEKWEAKNKELAKIFEQAGDDIDLKKVTDLPAGVAKGDTKAIAELVRQLNDEAGEFKKEIERLESVDVAAKRVRESNHSSAAERGTAHGGDGASALSVGQLFVKSNSFLKKEGNIGPQSTLDIELKTLMESSTGWVPETTRTGRVVDFATRPIQVTDLIPATTTQQNAVTYMEETTFTNAAVETAEAGTYQEAALALTEKSSLVRKVAVFLPVTDEQLEDESQVRGYVDNRLGFMVRQRLDSQILVGNGTAPNLRGLLNIVGIQTQAKGADPAPDAVYKAMIKVRVTGRALPNLVVYHPTNWQDIRLLRTADGLYIWGNPSDAGPDRIWGLPVAQSDAITLGTALVADSSFTELATKRGLDTQISNSHGTYFIEGKQAIRADLRVALVVYRPTAICTVTGL